MSASQTYRASCPLAVESTFLVEQPQSLAPLPLSTLLPALASCAVGNARVPAAHAVGSSLRTLPRGPWLRG